MSLIDVLRADLRADMPGERPSPRATALLLSRLAFSARLQAVVLLRISHALDARSAFLGAVVKWVNHVITGCDAAPQAQIGPGLQLFHPSGVVIGPDVRIGARCRFMQGVTLGAGKGGSPTLGDDVFLGAGATLYGAVTIGSRTHIGARAVVDMDVPDDAFVVGGRGRILSVAGARADEPA
jgi:serine O-acetyltransferase